MRLRLARSEGARRLGIVITVLVGIAGLLPSWLVLQQTQKDVGLYHSFMQLRKDGKVMARYVDRSRSPGENPATCSDSSSPEYRILMVTDQDSRYIITLEKKVGRPSTAKEWGTPLEKGVVEGYPRSSGKISTPPDSDHLSKDLIAQELGRRISDQYIQDGCVTLRSNGDVDQVFRYEPSRPRWWIFILVPIIPLTLAALSWLAVQSLGWIFEGFRPASNV